MPNAAITLTEEEQLKLEEILMDQDEKAALEFLRLIVKAKIEQQKKGHCQPPF
jgi:hypothetical protein